MSVKPVTTSRKCFIFMNPEVGDRKCKAAGLKGPGLCLPLEGVIMDASRG